KGGGLVAFPTETVYGLGADAFNPKAVAKIFEAKKRPLEDPLIVHIAQKEDLYKLAEDISDMALRLADEFWPGPLTLVLKKSKNIPDIITAGLNTVAIRVPANKVALALIKFSETPIAAPSANLFGRPSPTTAQHVLDDLKEKIDIVIDGGRALIGVESTILDLTQNPPVVLRPGGVSMEKLRKVVKGVEIYKQDKVLSPGMYPRHYSPKAKVIFVEGSGDARVAKVKNLAARFNLQEHSVGILAKEENKDKYDGFNVKPLGPGDDLTICAANLFSVLRNFDKEGVDIIIAESVKEEGLGLAIIDRLRKAAGSKK
ncbi:MAG: threonylcarbamoyl-AMP synthase, partial [Candidatus Omnitrophica bacterium]|nr:threonylcarbamoyl-AMP synthase [Candidatus Omnitrophota bacterium]